MPRAPRKPRKNFAQFLMESPLAGSGLGLERDKDPGRDPPAGFSLQSRFIASSQKGPARASAPDQGVRSGVRPTIGVKSLFMSDP